MSNLNVISKIVDTNDIRLSANIDSLSMSPLLAPGCEITVTAVSDLLELHKGDIIVRLDRGVELVCHRVVIILDDGILTKGDNNYIYDNKTTIDNIIGRVSEAVSESKRLDLSTRRSAVLGKMIAGLSLKCRNRESYYITEIAFNIYRLMIILLCCLYKKNAVQ